MALKQNPILQSFHKFGHFSTWKNELKLAKLLKFTIEKKIPQNSQQYFRKKEIFVRNKIAAPNPVFVNFK
jgi:hypothetical protein